MLRDRYSRMLLILIATVGAIPLGAGCGGSTRAYSPSSISAREALDAALSTWRVGGTPNHITTNSSPVQAVDLEWLEGQSIESYKILEEERREGDNGKWFSVVLNRKSPEKGEKKVYYVVVGRDPLWVFREDDYQRTANMGDNPTKPKSKRPARRR